MIAKNCGGVMPEPEASATTDKAILAQRRRHRSRCTREAMETQQLHRGARCELGRREPKPTAISPAQAPWALAKTDPARMGTVLYVTAEVVRQVCDPGSALRARLAARRCSICWPYRGASGLLRMLGGRSRHLRGHELAAAEPVFPRKSSRQRPERLIA